MLRFYIEFSAPMGRGRRPRTRPSDRPTTGRSRRPVPSGRSGTLESRPDAVHALLRSRTGQARDQAESRHGPRPYRRPSLHSDRQRPPARWERPAAERAYRHAFTAGPAEESALDPAKWNVIPPVAGTRGALTVLFPKPLDHGLLQRALGVQKTEPGAPGSGVDFGGEIRVEGNETRWVFTPTEPWTSGTYALVALPLLEDPAGNRIGRAFEVRSGEEDRRQPARIPFQVK